MSEDSSPPSAQRRQQAPLDGAQALEQALRGEVAVSFGKSGRAVEQSLAAVRTMPNDHPDYEARLYACADAVYRYFVQREMCNLTDHTPVIEAYDIPRAVLARVGGRVSDEASDGPPRAR